MKFFKFKYDDLYNPILEAIRNLGGSASISEMEDEVGRLMSLTEDEINDIHRGNKTKFSYRLAWARNYLKRYGLLDNSSRGIWALTAVGTDTKSVDKAEVNKTVKVLDAKKENQQSTQSLAEKTKLDADYDWQDELLEVLQSMPPDKFEKLCQRMLRELGFVNVEVTGRTGDGGIDGKGVVRLSGILSFHVVFQCKRYKGSVSPSLVRDFRGAMVGRADKGLLITTGSFTREARKEAQRDGAPPIDLIDGNQLTENIKALGLGVNIVAVERVELDRRWFQEL